MKNLTSIAVVCMALILGACASKQEKEQISEAKAQKKSMDLRNKELNDKIDALPKWVLKPPAADRTGLHAVGIGGSDNLQVSLRKAVLEAEFGLAKLYRQELAGSERMFTTDDAVGSNQRYEALIDKLVQSVPIVGYTVKNQVVKPVDGRYESYVLLHLPYDQYNEVLKMEKAKSMDKEMKAAFDDLERRLELRRQRDQNLTQAPASTVEDDAQVQ